MSVAERIAKIESRIENTCLRSGRKRDEITLMAVTKFRPVDAVEQAWKAGLRIFGESRVQEASQKFGSLTVDRAGMQLHLIGNLQSNKAKTAVSLFDCIQSVDRLSLIPDLAKYATGLASPLPLLFEFRTGESSKNGFDDPDDLFRAADLVLGSPSLKICGLMTMAPFTNDDPAVRSAFRRLAKLRQDLMQRFPGNENWEYLSMGMSGDFEIAIEEGSTMLRIGTAIFGG